MKIFGTIGRSAALVFGMIALGVGTAFAQSDYPSKPITIVTTGPAGGGLDRVCRVVADELAKVIGQNVIVENKPGAAGGLAAQYVAKAPADGYTLVFNSTSLIATKVTTKDPGFDWLEDFRPIAGLVEQKLILTANATTPFDTFEEFVDYAKANPGKLNFGHTGVGDALGLTMASINEEFGLDIVLVPYRGGGGAITQALLGNEIQVVFQDGGAVRQHLDANNAKALAQSGARSDYEYYAEVPTLAELDVPPGAAANPTFHLLAPADTPDAVVAKLNAAVVKVLESPSMKERIGKMGFGISSDPSPQALDETMTETIELFVAVGKSIGIEPK